MAVTRNASAKAASQTSAKSKVKGKGTGAVVKKKPSPKKKALKKDFVDHFEAQNIGAYRPGGKKYEIAVANANLMFRFSRPACVVQPKLFSHVQKVVKQAKSQGIPITIRNGGHSYSGSSTTNNGILLDLSKMNKVTLDMDSKIITLQGGALWGHAYKQLVNGRHDGYIVVGGRCVTVGVSGFILGGGIGPFTRSLGMGCDSLKEATIVTADGNLVVIKDSDDPKSDKGRLFWAICGAGGGNFGVVVELKMEVHKLQNEDGHVVAGRYEWYPDAFDRDDLISTMNRFYTTEWPDLMTIDSTWVCDVNLPGGKDVDGVRFIAYYDGTKDDFDDQIDTFIEHEELANQLKRRALPEKSTRFLHETLVAQWEEDTKWAFPAVRSYRIFSSFVFKNDKARIESLTTIIKEEMEAFRERFKGDSGSLNVSFIHSGGQASNKRRSDTAFRWRDGIFHTYIQLQWNDKWLERDMRGFCQELKERLRPFSMMRRAAFVNFPDGTIKSKNHERAYYGNNRQELQRIKEIWDKDNYFDWPQGVRLPPYKKKTSEAKATKSAGKVRGELPTGGEEEEDDEGLSSPESEVDEEGLTDMIAGQQWEDYNLHPMDADDFIGIRGLAYLGL